ncbi:ABC transporter permease [Marinicella sp. W31]|uniref:ABC transporter permease n=1 Tax=Marinicella sp. W31 TaxID=3023713 RepID=UPI0037579189
MANHLGPGKYWGGLHITITALIVLPLLALVWQAMSQSDPIFDHLMATVMGEYALNSLLLVLLTVALAVLIGFPAAWLTQMCRFPGSRQFRWLLIVPLAMPPYLLAYLYTDLLDYAGPVQRFLRSFFGWSSPADYWFFEIRSLPGAALILALALYPYLFLLVRAALREQSASMLHSCQLLGVSNRGYFWRVALPLLRPALVAGMALVGMETLADFATVHYFSVSTLTTAVYDTWLGHSNLTAAAKIAMAVLLGVVILVSLERIARSRMRYEQKGQQQKESVFELQGVRKWMASIWCALILLVSFILPVVLLLDLALQNTDSWSVNFTTYLFNSVAIAATAAGVCVLLGLWLTTFQRNSNSLWSSICVQSAALGYAIPGTVLAIAVLIPLSGLDHVVNHVLRSWDMQAPGLLFSGSVFIIIAAYVVRFIPLMIGSLESQYGRIPAHLDMAAMSLGQSRWRVFKRVHWHLLRRGLLVAVIMVFLESLKELPAVLLLRPFNFETLATWVYGYVVDEQLEQAASGALVLLGAGLLAVLLLNRSTEKT